MSVWNINKESGARVFGVVQCTDFVSLSHGGQEILTRNFFFKSVFYTKG